MIDRASAHIASPTQKQFWLLQQLDRSSAAYNIPSGFILRGVFDTKIFRECLLETVSRHEVLYSTYEMAEGHLYQVVGDQPRIDFRFQSIDTADDARFSEEVRRLMNDAASEPFDLETDPVVRLVLYSSAIPTLNALAIVIHHIAIDLRTKDIIGEMLTSGYTEKSAGLTSDSFSSPVDQYSAFCEWHSSWVVSDKAAHMAAFWRKHLHGRTLSIPLQPDHPRPSRLTFEGGQVPLCFDQKMTAAIHALSRDMQGSAFITLLAVYVLLLYRYTDSTDFVVGVPLTNRRVDQFKDMVGCFVNTLPVSVDIDETESFGALVRKVRMALLFAHRNQELPIERIVSETGIREESRNPLYQVGFTFEHPMAFDIKGVEVEQVVCDTGGAQLELFLRCWQDDTGLKGRLEYNRNLFSEENARRFVRCLETLLQNLLTTTDKPLSTAGHVPEEDVAALAQWNENQRPYALTPLYAPFEKQTAASPDDTALSFQDQTVTYSGFAAEVNQLARFLMEKGLGKGDAVPIVMNRSIEMWRSIYAVCRAGAAYVPIETDAPAARVAYMIQSLSPKLILTTAAAAPQLEALDIPVLFVDAASPLLEERNATPPDVAAALDDPAYVIYTSGSTGKPKAVVNAHGGIANRLCWMQEAFPLDRHDRILAKTPYSFDVSVWEIFWPLQVGASIEIAPPGAHRDPAQLSRLIASKGVTTIHFVPSMLDAFLAYDWGDALSCLKRVICSGEVLPRDLQDRFHDSLPAVALHNLYGPTEAAIDVTHWRCRKADPRPFVPIGRAVANTRLYIVDRNLHQTGVGVPGEICIGGVQVALGYWNEPLLTERVFLDDPFSGNGDRMYKTGDMGRFLDDGNIQFLGRKDGQEKIRGNRVELGEIETVLRAHPAVREAAVVVGTSASRKTKTLAAYFCPKEVSAASVRDHLAGELPGYMIPALLIPLERLPHTPSGKIDRRALLEMAVSAAPLPEEESTAPSTELEKHLTALWQEVLGDRTIGARMNFFDLGGDSILLMQVYARLRHRYGDQLQLASMFQYPTIERLAWFLENGLESDGPSEKEKIESRAERVKSVRGRLRKRQR